jgi:hypothetical protein
LTGSISWSIDGVVAGTGGSLLTTLSDGNHTITASVTDSGGNTTDETISLTVGIPTVATSVSVDSISYTTEGGRRGDKNLLVTVALIDDLGNPNSGASVSIQLNLDSGASWTSSATTGDDGTMRLRLRNAPAGVYSTVITNVAAGSLNWDDTTPTNSYSKGGAGNVSVASESAVLESVSPETVLPEAGEPSADIVNVLRPVLYFETTSFQAVLDDDDSDVVRRESGHVDVTTFVAVTHVTADFTQQTIEDGETEQHEADGNQDVEEFFGTLIDPETLALRMFS